MELVPLVLYDKSYGRGFDSFYFLLINALMRFVQYW